MKRMMLGLVIALSGVAICAPVELEQAAEYARSFALSADIRNESRSPVTNVVSVLDGEDVAYYIAYRADGGAIFVNADTRLNPILAVIPKFGGDGAEGDMCSPLREMVRKIVRDNQDGIKGTNAVSVRGVTTGVGTSSDKKARLIEANEKAWAAVSSRRFVGSNARNVSNGSIRNVYHLISGFETEGRYTHWGQSIARLGMWSVSPYKACYNYYMCCASRTGSDANGLKMNVPPYGNSNTYIPCGCGATAMAAVMQATGAKGIMPNPQYRIGRRLPGINIDGVSVMTNVHFITGEYDWNILPTNYGGTSAVVTTSADFRDEWRELLGRITYNCGIILSMQYDFGSSGCYNFNFIGGLSDNYGLKGYGDHFDGYGEYWHLYSIYGQPTESCINIIKAYCYADVPVVLTISGNNVGYAVVAAGVLYGVSGDISIRIFMGWSGQDDAWINFSDWSGIGEFSSLSCVICPSLGDGRCLPWSAVSEQNNSYMVYNEYCTNTYSSTLGLTGGMLKMDNPEHVEMTSAVYRLRTAEFDRRILEVSYVKDRNVYVPDMDNYPYGEFPREIRSPYGEYKYTNGDSVQEAVEYTGGRGKKFLMVNDHRNGGMDRLVQANYSSFSNEVDMYFLDVDEEIIGASYDCTPSVSIYDPQRWVSADKMYEYENGRLSYGTFTNQVDFMDVIRRGLGE